MDKEKQICKHFEEEVCSKLDCKKDCKYYGKSNCKTCIHEDICQLRTFSYCEEEVKEKGCEHYQLKINENEVVISKEEKQKLLKEMYEQGKFDAIADLEKNGKVVIGKEEYRKLKLKRKNAMAMETARKVCEHIENDNKNIRKETAREIFKKLKVELKGYIGINYLEELAKEFGVDLGEEK